MAGCVFGLIEVGDFSMAGLQESIEMLICLSYKLKGAQAPYLVQAPSEAFDEKQSFVELTIKTSSIRRSRLYTVI